MVRRDKTSKSSNRQYIRLGPYHRDMLKMEAILKGRNETEEGGSLLSAFLNVRQPKRNEMIEHVAKRRKLSVAEFWTAVLDETISFDDDIEGRETLEDEEMP